MNLNLIDVGASFQEEPSHLHIVPECGPVQGRAAGALRGINANFLA